MSDPWTGQGFGWKNMFVAPEDDPRKLDRHTRGERDTLVTYLSHQRQTLEMKCTGLNPEQLSMRAVPPSDLTLLGLVRHLAGVEFGWFQRVMQGVEGPRPFRPNHEPTEEWHLPEPSVDAVEEAFDAWRRQCAATDEFVARTDLDAQGSNGMELREVLAHMIEEYARHLGHADLIREAIDGRRGE